MAFRESVDKIKSDGFVEWFFDFAFYVFDIILLPELYECILSIIKSDYRFLSSDEKELAKQYFGDAINLNFVRINSQMSRRIEKKAHAYVTLNTINYREQISKPIFLHEMVHIWQYQRFGSMYIYRALKAQNSKLKYDYGGLDKLYTGMISQHKFIEFNFEQQGAIIEDYCRLVNTPDSFKSPIVKISYEYYVTQLRYK